MEDNTLVSRGRGGEGVPLGTVDRHHPCKHSNNSDNNNQGSANKEDVQVGFQSGGLMEPFRRTVNSVSPDDEDLASEAKRLSRSQRLSKTLQQSHSGLQIGGGHDDEEIDAEVAFVNFVGGVYSKGGTALTETFAPSSQATSRNKDYSSTGGFTTLRTTGNRKTLQAANCEVSHANVSFSQRTQSEGSGSDGYAGSASSNNDMGGSSPSSGDSSSSGSDDDEYHTTRDRRMRRRQRSCTKSRKKRTDAVLSSSVALPLSAATLRRNLAEAGGSYSSDLADFSTSGGGSGESQNAFSARLAPFTSPPRTLDCDASHSEASDSTSDSSSDEESENDELARIDNLSRTNGAKSSSATSTGLNPHRQPESALKPHPPIVSHVEASSAGTKNLKRCRSRDGTGATMRPSQRMSSYQGAAKREEDAAMSSALKMGMSILERSFKTKMDRAAARKGQQRNPIRMGSATAMSSLPPGAMAVDPVFSPSATDMRSPLPMMDKSYPAIYSVGVDVMGHCMSYLEPVEVHALLTMPLSKLWRKTFTEPQDLWKVLCLSEPFYAKLDDDSKGEGGSGDDAMNAFPFCNDLEVRHLFGRYRLLYTSFVRCMKYLARIKDDAINGRAPSVAMGVRGTDGVDHSSSSLPFQQNESLKNFFAMARGAVRKNDRSGKKGTKGKKSGYKGKVTDGGVGVEEEKMDYKRDSRTVERESDESFSADEREEVETEGAKESKDKPSRPKIGYSKLTENLLGPSKGKAGPVDLPWSCAIYSVVNWMVAFSDVEGIQVMCLKALPSLLEDETQRTTAQRAGLTDIVLRGMVLFPDSVELHTAAFHTLVLLARPLGGKEGMLFHSAMVNASGIFNVGSGTGKNGIAVMLDSMRRFEGDAVLQAMSCWSMVNIALMPSQKTVLVKLGGISVASNAMMQHPHNAEVQFRALFALINLVIPSSSLAEGKEAETFRQQWGDVVPAISEKEILDENVGQIANLVVVAMKNFCTSEAILNRACLVLHNLSLNDDYHATLLWTPNCYQMLEWCIGNYRTDQVLQQSATGTLNRLQSTLGGNAELRSRFMDSLRQQREQALEQVRREAIYMQERHEVSIAARPRF